MHKYYTIHNSQESTAFKLDCPIKYMWRAVGGVSNVDDIRFGWWLHKIP